MLLNSWAKGSLKKKEVEEKNNEKSIHLVISSLMFETLIPLNESFSKYLNSKSILNRGRNKSEMWDSKTLITANSHDSCKV